MTRDFIGCCHVSEGWMEEEEGIRQEVGITCADAGGGTEDGQGGRLWLGSIAITSGVKHVKR